MGAGLFFDQSLVFFSLLFPGSGRSAICLDVVRVPRQITFVQVLDMARGLEFMVFVWIDDQHGVPSQCFQRKVHLLAAENRDIAIDVSADKHGWRQDVFNPIKRSDAVPNVLFSHG